MARPITKRTVAGKPPLPPRPIAAPKKVEPPARADLVYHFDVPQDSDEWRTLRLGKVTASEIGTVMSQSDDSLTRTGLMRDLAGELLTEEPAEGYSNRYMERGKEMEPIIRDWYSRRNLVEVQQCGFVYDAELDCGWSPDGLVGDEGAVEIKFVKPRILIGILDRGVFPPEHRHQCHGALWIGRRKWIDLVVYSHAKMPKFVARLEPDEVFHRQIADEVERFQYQLKKLVEKMRSMRR